MVFASIVSILVILFFLFYLIKIDHFRKVDGIALVLKIGAGILLGLIYKYYYGGGDTFQYFKEAGTIASFFLDHPQKVIDIYFHTEKLEELRRTLIFDLQPRALFFSKVISVFYLVSGGNYWIISMYMSFLSFLGINFLVYELNGKFPDLSKATIISFYFLPTFVFWTSGLLKESLTIGTLTIAVSTALRLVRSNDYSSVWDWLLLFISLLLLWKLKYYYAAVLIPLISFLLIYNLPGCNNKLKRVLAVVSPILVAAVVSNLHYNLNPKRVFDVVYENYKVITALSHGGSIHYFGFDGSFTGFLINIPAALFGGLFRPVILESGSIIQQAVGLEHTVVLGLCFTAIWKSGCKKIFRNHYTIIVLVYVTSLATMMAFVSPNFGTLSRYKVAYWPFFVLLTIALVTGQQKKARAITT
ncbi:MAG: hypothetical protein MI975_23610 [Cytophagales bacterium]|nr:hypothetical protein [Cytophagales bacterium]